MYDAVTGMARPSIHRAMAVYAIVRYRLLPARLKIIIENLSPRPVKVTTPTMIPAVAQVAATERTSVLPSVNACRRRGGVKAVSRRMKLKATDERIAYTTAKVAV